MVFGGTVGIFLGFLSGFSFIDTRNGKDHQGSKTRLHLQKKKKKLV